MNFPEDGLVGPKHVEIRRYMNKIETVTSVGFFISYGILYLRIFGKCVEKIEVSLKSDKYNCTVHDDSI